jgi:hypothetical protein
MVMVVADAILEASRGSCRLDATDETFGGEQAEGVVDRLQRDGADLVPDRLRHRVSRDVRLSRHGTHHS